MRAVVEVLVTFGYLESGSVAGSSAATPCVQIMAEELPGSTEMTLGKADG